MKRWTEKEFSQWVYYDDQDGKIIGAVYKIGNSNSIWGGKVYLVNNTEQVMGQYIDSDYARKSVELYWEIDSRTLLEQQ
jgi:CTP:phosphocholine cytidylyltransferase-like protein